MAEQKKDQTMMGGVGKTVGNTAEGATGLVGGLVGNLGKTVGDAAGGLGKTVTGATEGVGQTVSGAGSSVKGATDSTFGGKQQDKDNPLGL